jgi:DNA repair protein RecN (Recombination protein N)
MIDNLHIKNVGIIDDISINFKDGLNVLTGETGAGKTLIIDSLRLLSGERFSKEMIRTGENYAFVEASINCSDAENVDDIIVSREVNKNGKNLCKINGRMVTCVELREFMKNILYIHGQNDNLTILDESTHIEVVDLFSKEEIKTHLLRYRELFNEHEKIKQELINNYSDDKQRQRMLDILNYEVKELDEADLRVDEDDEIKDRIKLISSAEKIATNLQSAENQISNNVIDSLSVAIRDIEKISNFKAEYNSILQVLKSSYYEIQENLREISNEVNEVEFDEEELNNLEERLELINKLKRKYGNTIAEIIEYANSKRDEIDRINNLEEQNQELNNRLNEIENKMLEVAKHLTQIREKNSKKLSESINTELKDLEMCNAKFIININQTKQFNCNGIDKVEFMIITNVGDEAKPLSKIASGGEMSRIMLAIKNILADVDEVPIMVFDEIDTGISGNAANSVGDKMKLISKKHQVICITHQAAIAAKGDYNYFISKNVKDNRTSSKVKMLTEKETINEIARISSGSTSIAALNHAKELRERKLKLVI